jgi:hypothetical protein
MTTLFSDLKDTWLKWERDHVDHNGGNDPISTLLNNVPIAELPTGDQLSCSICHNPFGTSTDEDATLPEMPAKLPCGHIFGVH